MPTGYGYSEAGIEKLAKALVAFQAEMGSVTKDAINPFFKSKYASFDSIVTAIKPHMKKHGLAFVQFPNEDGLSTMIVHESGQFIRGTAKIVVKDQTPQGYGSGLTYMRRYALAAALGLATEDDDDGNGPNTSPVAAKKPPQSVAKPKDDTRDIKQAENAAKDRIVKLIDGAFAKEKPDKKDKVALKKFYGDKVFDVTGMSLPLAGSVEELEAIGEALAKELA